MSNTGAYAALCGIEPVAPSRPSNEVQRLVRVDAREVEKLREQAKFAHADPHDAEEDAFYERHRSMILGATS